MQSILYCDIVYCARDSDTPRTFRVPQPPGAAYQRFGRPWLCAALVMAAEGVSDPRLAGPHSYVVRNHLVRFYLGDLDRKSVV